MKITYCKVTQKMFDEIKDNEEHLFKNKTSPATFQIVTKKFIQKKKSIINKLRDNIIKFHCCNIIL